jgi:hypothetical protein
MNFKKRVQLSLVLPNETGILARAFEALSEPGINVEALSLVDTIESGTLRLVVDDPEKALAVLQSLGISVIMGEVFELCLKSGPGLIGRLCRKLSEAGTNIDYLYGADLGPTGEDRLILKASPSHLVEDILSRPGSL